jgi:hypothetical protein
MDAYISMDCLMSRINKKFNSWLIKCSKRMILMFCQEKFKNGIKNKKILTFIKRLIKRHKNAVNFKFLIGVLNLNFKIAQPKLK